MLAQSTPQRSLDLHPKVRPPLQALNLARELSLAVEIPSDFSDSEDHNGTRSYIDVLNAFLSQKPDNSQLDGCPLFYEDHPLPCPKGALSKDDSILSHSKRKSYKIDLSVFHNSFDDFMINAHVERCHEAQNDSLMEKGGENDASYFFQNIGEAPEEDLFEKSVQILTTVDLND